MEVKLQTCFNVITHLTVVLWRPWQMKTHCCRHIVADTNVSPFARMRNICCGHKFCVRDTKNVSDFVQKHFVSATNVSQFAHARKHHEQQCFRNNVSSFATAFSADHFHVYLLPSSCITRWVSLSLYSLESICSMGPLHDPVTWYKIIYTGEQVAQWDFQNKGRSRWTGTSCIVLEVPLRNLLTSIYNFVPCDWVVQRAHSLKILFDSLNVHLHLV